MPAVRKSAKSGSAAVLPRQKKPHFRAKTANAFALYCIYCTLLLLLQSSKGTNRTLATVDNNGIFHAVDRRVTYLGGNGIRISNLTADDDGLVKGEIIFKFGGVGLTEESVVNVTSRIFIFGKPTICTCRSAFLRLIFTNAGEVAYILRFTILMLAGVNTPHVLLR